MNAISAHVAREVDEFAVAGLTAVPSALVKAPRVGESPVAFECRLTQIAQLKSANGVELNGWLTLGEVVAVHIDKSLIKGGVYHTTLPALSRAPGGVATIFKSSPTQCSRCIARTNASVERSA